MAQGWSTWRRGAFEEAVRSWQDAVQRYDQTGQPRAQSVALTQLARPGPGAIPHGRAEPVLSLRAGSESWSLEVFRRQLPIHIQGGDLGKIFLRKYRAARDPDRPHEEMHLGERWCTGGWFRWQG
jgi:hypothetical protein